MTGTPEGSTESGFMEKPEIEPATPGLQGTALNHYTTGASMAAVFCLMPTLLLCNKSNPKPHTLALYILNLYSIWYPVCTH